MANAGNASKSSKRRWTYGDDVNETELQRSAFTPGWNRDMTSIEGLPVKIGGKVIKTYIQQENRLDSDVIDEPINHSNDRDDMQGYDSDVIRNITPNKKSQQSAKTEINVRECRKKLEQSFKNIDDARYHIGRICSSITANPEKALTRRRSTDDEADQEYPRLSDLLELLVHSNQQIVEMTMLSLLLVFKDICPSFRIRLENDEVQLKKETKRRRDIDRSLLDSYKKYITFLDDSAKRGLGNMRKQIKEWNTEAIFGLSAYRCQCELVRSLYHFNFRSLILTSVLTRATQPNEEISKICIDSIDYIFKSDPEGEVTFEVVRLIAKSLAELKYDVDESFIRVLERVKLSTHADCSDSIRKQVNLLGLKSPFCMKFLMNVQSILNIFCVLIGKSKQEKA